MNCLIKLNLLCILKLPPIANAYLIGEKYQEFKNPKGIEQF